jgi:hypothetical protein
MATDTTGSAVQGLNQGLPRHLGGGVELIFVLGNPSGIVNTILPGAVAQNGVSGGVIAYDNTNNKFYMHLGSMVWQQMGSVSFG